MELTLCKLRTFREWRELSTEKLALRAGVSEREIRKLESNSNCNPTRRTMLKLAIALQVPVQRIFYPDQDRFVPGAAVYEQQESYGD